MFLSYTGILKEIIRQTFFKNTIHVIKVFLFSLCCLNFAYAEDAPNRVYAFVESEDLQNVFDHGINPLGNNLDLMDLISGNTQDDSAYVMVSGTLISDLANVERFAEDTGLDHFVVFSIRPDNGFYSVDASLYHSMNNARYNNPALFMRLWVLYNEQTLGDYAGWVTNRTIPGNQIESAMVYTLQGNTWVRTIFQNPNYVQGTPSVNNGVISMTGASDQYVYYRDLGTYGLLPGQMCNSFSSSSISKVLKDNSDHGVCTQHTYVELRLRLMKTFSTMVD